MQSEEKKKGGEEKGKGIYVRSPYKTRSWFSKHRIFFYQAYRKLLVRIGSHLPLFSGPTGPLIAGIWP